MLFPRLRRGVSAAAAVISAAACTAESSPGSAAGTASDTGTPSAAVTDAPTAESAGPPRYCMSLSMFDTSVVFLYVKVIGAVSDDLDEDPATRLDVAQEVGRLGEESLMLSYSTPPDLAAALLTVNEALLDMGNRILDGDPLVDTLGALSGQAYTAANDLIDDRNQWGACADA
jgi:hypothetical protein